MSLRDLPISRFDRLPDELLDHSEAINILNQDRTSQSVHHVDWVAINSTNRRFRRVGKVAFFASKTFALSSKTLSMLQSGTIHAGLYFPFNSVENRVTALENIRDLVVVDHGYHSITSVWWFKLVLEMAIIPKLCRLTICFYSPGNADDMSTAVALAIPVPTPLQNVMIEMGMPEKVLLNCTIAPRQHFYLEDLYERLGMSIVSGIRETAKVFPPRNHTS
ncbi:hypothetical protein HD806DRAFT_535333 [Xylariaceae sp. AK1471]|nr:hypothetical protein HD806DRAFT_535333 [Xylariaceae sp. AK1471]